MDSLASKNLQHSGENEHTDDIVSVIIKQVHYKHLGTRVRVSNPAWNGRGSVPGEDICAEV